MVAIKTETRLDQSWFDSKILAFVVITYHILLSQNWHHQVVWLASHKHTRLFHAMPARISSMETGHPRPQARRSDSGGLPKLEVHRSGRTISLNDRTDASDVSSLSTMQSYPSVLLEHTPKGSGRQPREPKRRDSSLFPVSMPSLVEGSFDHIWEQEPIDAKASVVVGVWDGSGATDSVSDRTSQHSSASGSSIDVSTGNERGPSFDHSFTSDDDHSFASIDIEDGLDSLKITAFEKNGHQLNSIEKKESAPHKGEQRFLIGRRDTIWALVALKLFILGLALGKIF